MEAAIQRLRQSIDEARSFFGLVRELDALRASGNLVAPLAGLLSGNAWRRQAYSLSIILIYGAHERFVRDLCLDLARATNASFASYQDLPLSIQKEHLRLTAEMMLEHIPTQVDAQRPPTAIIQAVANLKTSFEGGLALNHDVFSKHSANFRVDMLRRVLRRLDIALPSAPEALFDSEVLAPLQGLHASIEGVIDDLADRRNDVAHGSTVDSVLDLETTESILEAVFRYDLWLVEVSAQQILRRLLDRSGTWIARVARTWTLPASGEREIAGVDGVDHPISVGVQLFVRDRRRIRKAEVREIQLDHVSRDQADPGDGPFGIRLDIAVHEGCELLILGSEWSAVAEALVESSESQHR